MFICFSAVKILFEGNYGVVSGFIGCDTNTTYHEIVDYIDLDSSAKNKCQVQEEERQGYQCRMKYTASTDKDILKMRRISKIMYLTMHKKGLTVKVMARVI